MLSRIVVCCVMTLSIVLTTSSRGQAAPPTKEQIDRAIASALVYLKAQQLPAGSWRADAYGEMTSITSLSVMAYFAAGHMPGEGPYGASIDRGITWVLDHQHDNGLLLHRQSHGPMYCHGVSTLMLAEAVGMVRKGEAPKLRRALERAVALILTAQEVRGKSARPREAGGWRYNPGSLDSDLSVTGWQLLALRAAKNVGCDVPAENIDAAVAYVKLCSGGGGFTYQPGDGPTSVRTGTGILALEICGEHHAPESLSAADFLLRQPLRPRQSFYYYGAYYCTVGMYQVGGKHWEAIRDIVYEDLLALQQPDGGWSPTENSEAQAGRVYCTAMAVLALAVEYQYLPIYQR